MENNIYTVKLYDVKHYGNWDSENEFVFLVMEYVNNDLSELMDNKPENFDQNHLTTIVYNFCCAINFLHSAGIIHRDLKSNNILYANNCRIVLCDFGSSRSICKE
jgi:cell division cycle 2-like